MPDYIGLEYSEESKIPRMKLFQEYNDVNFIVEDEDKEYMYETILKRLFCDELRIKTVSSMGGKNGVIRAYHELGRRTPNPDSKPNFYIVDGDFDRYIDPENMINDVCFLYLKAYCIENYYIDQNASLLYAKGFLCCQDEDVKTRMCYETWKQRILDESIELFFIFCYILKYHPEIPSVSKAIDLYISPVDGFKKEEFSIELYRNKILAKTDDAEVKFGELKAIIDSNIPTDYFDFICGKFLLSSLYFYMKSKLHKNFHPVAFGWHLVCNFDIGRLDYLKAQVKQFIKDN